MELLVGFSCVQFSYVFLSVVVVALVIGFGVGRWSSYVPRDKEKS